MGEGVEEQGRRRRDIHHIRVCIGKKVKVHTSQRPKQPGLILVPYLAGSIARSIATPSLDRMLHVVHGSVTPSSMLPVPIYTLG